jgi:hypothetical protein
VVQVTALVIVNSVKIGIRLFDKWVKPLDSVKVSESSYKWLATSRIDRL